MLSDWSELTLAGQIITVGINPSTDTTSLNLTRQSGLRQHSRKDEKIGSVSIRTAGDGWHVSSCLMLTSIISRLQTISEEGSDSADGCLSFFAAAAQKGSWCLEELFPDEEEEFEL